VENHLPNVVDPTLIIQAAGDPVVDSVSGQEIFDKIGTKEKELFIVNANHHGILRGAAAQEVCEKVLEFLNEVASK
jgi:esterase/lipase